MKINFLKTSLIKTNLSKRLEPNQNLNKNRSIK